eukprot:g462.t1
METSYRQVGLRKGGVIYKGPAPSIKKFLSNKAQKSMGSGTRGAQDLAIREKRTTPSIPSKFETKLNVGREEKNAFGARTFRFRSENANVNPGPGKYHKKREFVRTQKTCGSVSKLGYSVGFVSKTKRFKNKMGLVALEPGPGQYEVHASKTLGKDHCRAPYSSQFAVPTYDQASSQTTFTPGPGAYNPYMARSMEGTGTMLEFDDEDSEIESKGTSSFTSKSKRGHNAGRYSTPGPGAHNVQKSFNFKYDQGKTNRKLPSSSFRSTSERGSLGGNHTTPGPGSYGTQKSAFATNTKAGIFVTPHGRKRVLPTHKPSSMFIATTTDRFGKPIKARASTNEGVPGPGSYGTVYKERSTAVASSSYFVSNVQRIQGSGPGSRPPGPAYYNPSLPGKKSFMLNLKRRFI